MESSPDLSASLDELLLIDAAIEDVSVLAPLMLESFGVEVTPVESRYWRAWPGGWSSESEDE